MPHRHTRQDQRKGQGPVVAITPAAMRALDTIRQVGAIGDEKVFGLSEAQIARQFSLL